MRAPETLAEALGQKVREHLARHNWSQREFARRLGMSQSAVSKLLGAKRRAQALDYYDRVATRIFHVRLAELILDLQARVDAGRRHRYVGGGSTDAPRTLSEKEILFGIVDKLREIAGREEILVGFLNKLREIYDGAAGASIAGSGSSGPPDSPDPGSSPSPDPAPVGDTPRPAPRRDRRAPSRRRRSVAVGRRQAS